MVGVVAIGQNSLRTENNSLITIIPSSTAATSGTLTLPIIAGEADWSVQVMPVVGGSLTPDSCYGTVRIYYSNSSSATAWSEPKQWDSFATGGLHTYFLRDTIANTTVALSPGVIISGKAFPSSRIKVHVDRPQSTDSVNYRVYYVIKYPQNNPQR